MDVLVIKYNNLHKAFDSLEQAINLYKEIQKISAQTGSFDRETLEIGLRDSLIQRFEYSFELFWKYLKLYLEEKQLLKITLSSPRTIITEATKAHIISEAEAERILSMIESRNMTSHIYKEEIAQQIAQAIPEYYKVLIAIINRLKA